jgi:hypothetical protein
LTAWDILTLLSRKHDFKANSGSKLLHRQIERPLVAVDGLRAIALDRGQKRSQRR